MTLCLNDTFLRSLGKYIVEIGSAGFLFHCSPFLFSYSVFLVEVDESALSRLRQYA